MANLCESLLNKCIQADCENTLYAGVAPTALIMNFSDIASVTYDSENASIVNGITMKTDGTTTKCAYTVQQLGNKPFEGSQTELTEGTYGNKFNHTINLVVLDNGPEITENIIDQLANGKFCVILQSEYLHTNADNKYQVYGLKKGLKCTAITREVWGDNESAYLVTLVEENSPKSGLFFFTTDEQTTDSAVAALKCTCA